MRTLAMASFGALVIACGARTELPDLLNGKGGSAGSTSQTGGTTSKGGAPGTGGSNAGGSGGVPPIACHLSPHGDPFELLSFPEGDTDTPLMAVLDPGSGAPATLGYAAISEDANFWHPEIRVGELVVGEPWPDGVKFSKPPILYGFDAHAWGLMAHAADPNANALALAFYHADEASPNVKPALKFRSFDATSWQPGAEVPIDPDGTVVYALVPGQSVSNGSHSGLGYGVIWRATTESDPNFAEPRIAVLDQAGSVVLGPIQVAPPETYPGRVSDVVWTGAAYLVTTPSGDCGPTADCIGPGVSIRALDPASSSLQARSFIPVLDPNTTPRRASLSSFGGRTFVAWTEAAATPDDAPRSVRVAELSSQGELVGNPELVEQNAHPAHAISVSASALGLVLFWGQPLAGAGDAGVGSDELVIQHRPNDAAKFERFSLPATSFAYGPAPTLVATSTPRALFVSWGGHSAGAGKDVAWFARLDCL